MTEHEIQNKIRVELAERAVLFRTNAGRFWQGRRVYSREFGQMVLVDLQAVEGLPAGYSDLSGVRVCDGRAVFIEVKRPGQKPRADQQRFLEVMARYGALAGAAHSVDEAKKIIEGMEK